MVEVSPGCSAYSLLDIAKYLTVGQLREYREWRRGAVIMYQGEIMVFESSFNFFLESREDWGNI